MGFLTKAKKTKEKITKPGEVDLGEESIQAGEVMEPLGAPKTEPEPEPKEEETKVTKETKELLGYFMERYGRMYPAENFMAESPAVGTAEICKLLFGILCEIKELRELAEQ